jgi:hypothetical protein
MSKTNKKDVYIETEGETSNSYFVLRILNLYRSPNICFSLLVRQIMEWLIPKVAFHLMSASFYHSIS